MNIEKRFPEGGVTYTMRIVGQDASPLAKEIKTKLFRSLEAGNMSVKTDVTEITASGRVIRPEDVFIPSPGDSPSGEGRDHTLRQFEPGSDPRLLLIP